jgi:hypothetical protein
VENAQPSAPFSIQVINPILHIQIIRQPSGDVDVAQALPVQPILSIRIRSDSPSIVGQLVRAVVDSSCYAEASALSETCTIADDDTCTFHTLSVVGIRKEVLVLILLCDLTTIIFLIRGSTKFVFAFTFSEAHPRHRKKFMCAGSFTKNFTI